MFSSFPVVILPHYCLIWSMYLCVWVGGGKHASYSCMHSTLCVASWQNVGHHRTITCTNITKILLITISLCVCPSFLSHCVSAPLSLYLSVPFIFVLCDSFTLIIRACVGKYPWAFFLFYASASHLYIICIHSPLSASSDISVSCSLWHHWHFSPQSFAYLT